MSAAATQPRGGERRRPARSLYEPLDWALIRAPMLPAAAAPDPGDPRLRAAVAVASHDLAAALDRAGPGPPADARLRRKLRRYAIRMRARPTPFGLFAGVGLADWGDVTDIELSPDAPRTRTRPDMAWLLGLVAALEQDPAIRPRLQLQTSPAVLVRGGRAFTARGTDAPVSVRATGAVLRALGRAREPVSVELLEAELARAPGATPEKAAALVDALWRQGFLLSELRPPLTGGDPARHVLGRLQAVAAHAPSTKGLAELLERLAGWDRLPLAARAGPWPELLGRAHDLHAGAGEDVLQTDLALPLAESHVHRAVGAEAARAADLLVRLSPLPGGPPHLDAYRQAFERRYGADREVGLLELVDAELGLGPLGDHAPAAPSERLARRDRLLLAFAAEAHRDGRPVVELDDELLGRLQTWDPEPDRAPPTLDVSLFVAAASRQAIDDGDFLAVVGPNLGAGAAGRTLGRFADLLGGPARAALERAAAAEAAHARGRLLAEVVHQPSLARTANVAVRPAVQHWEVTFGSPPGVPADRVIPAAELVVGVRGGRLAARWAARGLEVAGVQGHMLNPLHAPPAARLLLELAGDGRCPAAAFGWGTAAGLPWLPRVQRGRIVLALAQWRVEAGLEDVDAWRARWAVPRHVYVAAGDHRLLLDLDDDEEVGLLREEARAGGRGVVVQEALPGPEHAWLPGPDGGHLAEVVVPVARRPAAPSGSNAASPGATAHRPITGQERLRPPGSDWLYLKLHGPATLQDELIAGPLRAFGAFATGSGLARGWFFLRYADPEPHLRVRFHGDPAALTGPLLRQACDLAADLVREGSCTRFGLDTYEREVERYGGPAGVAAAEAVFMADSPAVAELLALSHDDALSFDPTALAAVTVDDLLASLGLSERDRAALYREAARLGPDDGEEYRRRKDDLRRLLGGPGPGEPVAGVLAARRAALAGVGARIDGLEVPREAFCRACVHLHLNRLLGGGPAEPRVLALLRRAREGLERAPLARAGRQPADDGTPAPHRDRLA